MNSKTLESINKELKKLKSYQDQLVTSLSKVDEEINLIEEEKVELLKSEPLGSAEGAALMLGIHPTQGGYSTSQRTN